MTEMLLNPSSGGVSPKIELLPRGADARRSPRTPRSRNLVLTPVRKEVSRPLVVALEDVSVFGIGFYHSEDLSAGTQFVLKLATEASQSMSLLFKVTHSRRTDDGLLRTGAELLRVLAPDERVEDLAPSEEFPEKSEPAPTEMKPESALPSAPVTRPEPEPEIVDKVDTGSFPADAAKGFDRTEHMAGVTVCNWEREIDIRRDGKRMWVYIHSPGKKNGWGIYVDHEKFVETVNGFSDEARHRIALHRAA